MVVSSDIEKAGEGFRYHCIAIAVGVGWEKKDLQHKYVLKI